MPARTVLAVVEDREGRCLQLECGHVWRTRRRFAIGQRFRCPLCRRATAASVTVTATPLPVAPVRGGTAYISPLPFRPRPDG